MRLANSMEGAASPLSYLPIISRLTPLSVASSVCDQPFSLTAVGYSKPTERRGWYAELGKVAWRTNHMLYTVRVKKQ
jgi:hypothetical protein